MIKLIGVRDTALILNIAVITLRRLIKRRGIPYHRVGRKYYFTEEDIETYLSQTAVPMGEENNEHTR
jgi:excisionase family DNA binding protein